MDAKNTFRNLKAIVWFVLLSAIWIPALYYQLSSKSVRAVSRATSLSGQTSKRAEAGTYGRASVVGQLKNRAIVESSGLTASRSSPGVYWTHNDSGDGPFIFALNARGGSLGVWRVTGADARDWEDIAAGPGPQAGKSYLYIGDIGDNSEARREIVVYRVPEPTISPETVNTSKSKPNITESAEPIRLRYPDGKHDAETVLIHPQTGTLFIVTKVLLDNPVVYEAPAPLNANTVTTMRRVRSINLPSLLGGVITGGSISPDGRRVALCDYFQGYEIVLPQGSSQFEDIWKQSFVAIDLGRRSQGEAIAYRMDSKALLATSEGRSSPLIQVVRR
jgi:hypothetical protein